MPIDLELKLDSVDLLYQESPICLVAAKNTGAQPIEFVSLDSPAAEVWFRSVNLKTGVEETTKTPPRSRRDRPLGRVVPPGQSIQGRFRLLEMLPQLKPGKYEISAIIKDAGGQKGESKPVIVAVAPTTPKNLSLVDVAGRTSAVLYGGWVNLASDPPRIVCSRFNLLEEGVVDNAIRIPKFDASPRTRPLLSMARNGLVASSHWVAWTEEDSLWFSHVDPRLGALEPSRLALPGMRAEVVAPLYTEPPAQPDRRPDGAVLLLLSEGASSRLQAFDLRPKQAVSTASLPLPGSRPVWAMAHLRGNGTRLVTYVQQEGDHTVLYLTQWPSGKEPPMIRQLAKWKGRHLTGGGSLDQQDAVRGASLLMVEEPGRRGADVVAWKLDVRGEFKSLPPQTIQWDPTKGLDSSAVRIDSQGNPSVLLRDAGGAWSLFFAGQRHALPGPVATTPFPLDVGFFGGGTRPILIVGLEGYGFRLMELDGSPLPPKFGG